MEERTAWALLCGLLLTAALSSCSQPSHGDERACDEVYKRFQPGQGPSPEDPTWDRTFWQAMVEGVLNNAKDEQLIAAARSIEEVLPLPE